MWHADVSMTPYQDWKFDVRLGVGMHMPSGLVFVFVPAYGGKFEHRESRARMMLVARLGTPDGPGGSDNPVRVFPSDPKAGPITEWAVLTDRSALEDCAERLNRRHGKELGPRMLDGLIRDAGEHWLHSVRHHRR